MTGTGSDDAMTHPDMRTTVDGMIVAGGGLWAWLDPSSAAAYILVAGGALVAISTRAGLAWLDWRKKSRVNDLECKKAEEEFNRDSNTRKLAEYARDLAEAKAREAEALMKLAQTQTDLATLRGIHSELKHWFDAEHGGGRDAGQAHQADLPPARGTV